MENIRKIMVDRFHDIESFYCRFNAFKICKTQEQTALKFVKRK